MNVKHFNLNTKCTLILLFLSLNSVFSSAQSGATQIYTDYEGFWQSSSGSINSNHPDSNQNLLAFTYLGTTYSTGVNDALLTDSGVTFTPLDFASFTIPSNSIIASTNGTYIGLGLNSTDAPVNDIPLYLTDGPNGLNLGTGIFNIPASKIVYQVSGFNLGAVGDGIPDVLLTQIGNPPGSAFDKFWFTDTNGDIVGDTVMSNVGSITVVAQQEWKFYNPGNPPTPATGNLGGPVRDLRIEGMDLSDFGLTPADIPSITNFVHSVSGESDQAFWAYNTTSFQSGGGVVLPINLKSFDAITVERTARLSWVASDAKDFSHFEVERSIGDSKAFRKIAEVKVNPETGDVAYSYIDEDIQGGLYFYRLKMVDNDLSVVYSRIVKLNFEEEKDVRVYPNPVSQFLKVDAAADLTTVSLYSTDGRQQPVSLSEMKSRNGIDVSRLPVGYYLLRITSGSTGGVSTVKFQVRR